MRFGNNQQRIIDRRSCAKIYLSKLHPIMYILSTKRYENTPLKQGVLPRFLGNILKCRLCVEFCLPKYKDVFSSLCRKFLLIYRFFLELFNYASNPYLW